MHTISSNHWSHDTQVSDAMNWLRVNHPAEWSTINRDFDGIVSLSSNFTEFCEQYPDVDPEHGSWLADAIEDTGLVQWIDGEPYVGPFEPDLWACRSCFDIVAFYPDDIVGGGYSVESVAAVEALGERLTTTEFEDHFSSRACHICHSRLGGSRHGIDTY